MGLALNQFTATDTYSTPATYRSINPPMRKITVIAATGDVFMQVRRNSVEDFAPIRNSEIYLPQGVSSKTFPEGLYGFRFRTVVPGAQVLVYVDGV
jgi:hypothetical protein